LSITVRQTPLTEIESPCLASDVTKGPRTATTAESATRVGEVDDLTQFPTMR